MGFIVKYILDKGIENGEIRSFDNCNWCNGTGMRGD
jgi:hypothetical protein